MSRTGLILEIVPSQVLGWQPQISYVFNSKIGPCQEDDLINKESLPFSDIELRVNLLSKNVSLPR